MSWNADVSYEYYPNADSMFSGAIYYKQFTGGFVPSVVNETYEIDGNTVVVPVIVDTATSDNSDLWGIELTAAYRFSSLPAPFDGLGVKGSYNYAESNFENHALRLGDSVAAVTGVVLPAFSVFRRMCSRDPSTTKSARLNCRPSTRVGRNTSRNSSAARLRTDTFGTLTLSISARPIA